MAKFSLSQGWIITECFIVKIFFSKNHIFCHRDTYPSPPPPPPVAQPPISCLFIYFWSTLLFGIFTKAALLVAGFPPLEMLVVGSDTGTGWDPSPGARPGAEPLALSRSRQREQQPWLAHISLSLSGAEWVAGFQHKLESKRSQEPPYTVLHGPESQAAAAVWSCSQTAPAIRALSPTPLLCLAK